MSKNRLKIVQDETGITIKATNVILNRQYNKKASSLIFRMPKEDMLCNPVESDKGGRVVAVSYRLARQLYNVLRRENVLSSVSY